MTWQRKESGHQQRQQQWCWPISHGICRPGLSTSMVKFISFWRSMCTQISFGWPGVAAPLANTKCLTNLMEYQTRNGNSKGYHGPLCCVHNASTVPWTSAGQFGRPRGVRGRPWYDLWRPRCVISHPMDVRGLPPGRPPSGRPRDTQFGIDWSLLPSGCPQGVRTAEVQPITARTHYGQEVGLPTVRPKPEVDVP